MHCSLLSRVLVLACRLVSRAGQHAVVVLSYDVKAAMRAPGVVICLNVCSLLDLLWLVPSLDISVRNASYLLNSGLHLHLETIAGHPVLMLPSNCLFDRGGSVRSLSVA